MNIIMNPPPSDLKLVPRTVVNTALLQKKRRHDISHLRSSQIPALFLIADGRGLCWTLSAH